MLLVSNWPLLLTDIHIALHIATTTFQLFSLLLFDYESLSLMDD